jgi:hypothetical protein
MLYDHQDIYNWYNNIQNLTQNKEIAVSFKGSKDPTRISHFPTYLKLKKIFRLETQEDVDQEKRRHLEAMSAFSKKYLDLSLPFYERVFNWMFRRKISDEILSKELLINGVNIRSEEYKRSLYPKEITDYSNFKLSLNSIAEDKYPISFRVVLDNIGESVVEDYKVRLYFEGEFEKIDTRNPSLSEIFAKTVKHDVFINDNTCVIQPENNFLVQKDFFVSETIILIPKLAARTEIKIQWELISRDYNNKGELYIDIEPNFELITKEYLVLDINDCKEVTEYQYKTYEYSPTQLNW